MGVYAAEKPLGEWRGKSWTFLAALTAGFLTATMTVLTIASLALPVSGGSAAWAIGVLFYSPIAYVAGRLTLGFSRAGVTISPAAVIVRNPWRTVTVPVAQAEGFKANSYGNGNAAVMLRVTTTGSWGAPNRPIILAATYKGGFIWTAEKRAARLEPVAVEMNSALTRAQAAPVRR
jgi:hypothetical protein